MTLPYSSVVYDLEDGNGLKHMNTDIKLIKKLHWVKLHGRKQQHHLELVTLKPTDATMQLSFFYEIKGSIFFSADTEIEKFFSFWDKEIMYRTRCVQRNHMGNCCTMKQYVLQVPSPIHPIYNSARLREFVWHYLQHILLYRLVSLEKGQKVISLQTSL